MSLAIVILFAVAIILLGATSSKPIGYVAVGAAFIALLLALFGSPKW